MALQAQVHNAALRLIDRTDESQGGSGVAVRIGARFFVATAAHVLDPNHAYEIAPRPGEAQIRDFVARGCDHKADVAFLEVRAADAHCMMERFWSDARLLESVDTAAECPVLMVGYPGRFLRPIAERDTGVRIERTIRCDAFTYLTATLRGCEWPKGSFETEPVVGRDVFISYDPEHQLHPQRPDTVGLPPPTINCEPPPLEGVSGCGIWVASHAASPIWRAQSFLLGIQVSYSPSRRWIRGTFIGHWLNLIARHYPDLTEQITAIRGGAAENLATVRRMVLASSGST